MSDDSNPVLDGIDKVEETFKGAYERGKRIGEETGITPGWSNAAYNEDPELAKSAADDWDKGDHAKAVEASREPFLRVMGSHRSHTHLQECYMIGSIDRIKTRIADLVGAGLEYLVLGPVTDDPRQIDLLARHIAPEFA